MTLEELYADMSAKAGECCTAMNEGKTQKAIKNLKKIAKDAETDYNAEVARLQYIAWAADGNPVETAIRERYVRNGKKVSYKSNDSGRFFVEISDATFKADLLSMEDAVGVEKFKAEDWFLRVQKLAFLLANALNSQLSNDPGFRYAVDDAAAVFQFADDADYSSDASILKALQQTVDSILFMPITNRRGDVVNRLKVIKPAWVYVAQCMTKQGNEVGNVSIANTGKMTELVADVMHCLLTGKQFKLVSA